MTAGRGRWQLMLMSTPGVSLGAAAAVAQAFPSPDALLREVEEHGEAATAQRLALLPCSRGIHKRALTEADATGLLRRLFPAACEVVHL